MGHCYISRRSISGGTGGDTELQTIGTAAYFDVSSVDVENSKWYNLLDKSKSMEITSGVTVSGDEVYFSPDDNGKYAIDKPSTMYAIFKVDENSITNTDAVIVTAQLSRLENKAAFDFWSGKGLEFATASNSVANLDVSATEYHVLCAARQSFINRSGEYGGFFVDGVYYGFTPNTLSDGYYAGNMLINTLDRGPNSPSFKTIGVTFKAIVFDTGYHTTEMIINNTRYLRNKYLNEME